MSIAPRWGAGIVGRAWTQPAGLGWGIPGRWPEGRSGPTGTEPGSRSGPTGRSHPTSPGRRPGCSVGVGVRPV